MQSLSKRVCIGLGSNLGRREEFLDQAFQAILHQIHFSNVTISSVYETKPVASAGGDYLNAAVVFETDWDAENIYRWMMAVEQNAGRTRGAHHAPRTLDLDLLFFGSEIISTKFLTVPHPRLHARAFVLVPLAEIVPNWIQPILKKSVQELRNTLSFDELLEVKKYEDVTRERSRGKSGMTTEAYENHSNCETISENA